MILEKYALMEIQKKKRFRYADINTYANNKEYKYDRDLMSNKQIAIDELLL